MSKLILFFGLFIFFVIRAQSGDLVVSTSHGFVEGFYDNGVRTFLGIPYAQPPIGQNRWRAPLAVASWSDVKLVKSYAQSCVQKSVVTQKTTGSEDCLYLNVWAPQKKKNEKLPVVVLIHGGGFVIGGSEQNGVGGNLYDGVFFAKKQKSIFVSMNYRLGAFGFLTHPKLDDEQSYPSGNFGLQDILLSLQWVKKNIGAFGGDTDRILLFGQSAGAIATCALMGMPEAQGYFSAAAVQSGFCELPTHAQRIHKGIKLSAQLGCEDDTDVAQCLRAKSPDDILENAEGLTPEGGVLPAGQFFNIPWVPHTDGKLIPRQPLASLKDPDYKHVPLIVGSTSQEATIFTNPIKIKTCHEYENYIQNRFQEKYVEVLKAYPCGLNPNKQVMLIATDIAFTCPMRRLAQVNSQLAPTYKYVFNYTNVGLTAVLGPFHLTDIIVLLGTYPRFFSTPTFWSENLSDSMQTYWNQLAIVNSPNAKGLPHWPQYSASTDKSIVLDNYITVTKKYRQARCDLWDSYVRN